jgi:hypothetical protein
MRINELKPLYTGVAISDINNGYIYPRTNLLFADDQYLLYNNLMIDIFGVPFLDGICASSDFEYISHYVNYRDSIICKIHPSYYKYCWSPDIKSLTEIDILDYHQMRQFIVNNYMVTGLANAIASGHEIMVFCDKCKVVPQ